MALIVGHYTHERNENFDEYLKAIGVPYIGRKMMGMSSPRLEIERDGEKWTVRTFTAIRTTELKFALDEEYEESMPSGETIKNRTTLEGDSLVTHSTGPNSLNIIRTYSFSPEGVVLTMSDEKSGQVAKRYYKRVVAT